MQRPLRWLLGLLLLTGSPAALAWAEPPPIPVTALFSNPAVDDPHLSPDGSQIAAVFSSGDVQVVTVRPTAGGEARPIARADHDEMRLKWIWWANDETLLLSATTRNRQAIGVRARATRLFSVPAAGGKLKWLGRRWPRHGRSGRVAAYQDQIVHDLPDDPDRVLISYWTPGKGPSIQRMNVYTGALRSFHGHRKDVKTWRVDEDGRVRVGIGSTGDDEYFVVARADADSPYHETIRYPQWQEEGPTFAGYSPDPDILYVHAPKDGRDALYEWNIQENELGKLVFAHDEVDVDGPFYGEDHRTLVGVWYTEGVRKLHFFDPDVRRVFRAIRRSLRKSLGGQLEIYPVSETDDHRLRIFRASGPTQPPVFYAYDQEKRGLAMLLESRPDVDRDRLSSPRKIEYTARDGMVIRGYLTLPKGRAESGLPLIVMPHGGPWSRDWLHWNPRVQLFASRGYAVFQPNFRGSEGFGQELLVAGYGEWGHAIQDDITDGVEWLVGQGIIDRDRIGIFGGSFGAYASLMGLVKTPDLYRAGAGYAGVYDIESMIDDDQWYGWFFEDWHEKMIGSDPERLRAGSPRRRAAEIRVPVLLAHGEDDQRVKLSQSLDMKKALQKAGKDVEYMEFENEIHGFLFERNSIAFHTRLVAFFDEHLAARPQAVVPER